MTVRHELIDEFLVGRDLAPVMRQDGLLGELKQALLNRLMAAKVDPTWGRTASAGAAMALSAGAC